MVITCFRGSPKKLLDLSYFQFDNRLSTTCHRFHQSFALPDKAVQFQLSWGKQAARLFGWSIALLSKHNERCKRQYRHEPPPAFALLRQGSPSFKSRHSLSYTNHFQDHGIYTFTCTYQKTYAYTYTNTHSYTFTHIYIQTCLYIFEIYLHVVTDTTTFEMELCGHKQATAHAHVQSHCTWLNFEHSKNSNRSKKIRSDENRIRICWLIPKTSRNRSNLIRAAWYFFFPALFSIPEEHLYLCEEVGVVKRVHNPFRRSAQARYGPQGSGRSAEGSAGDVGWMGGWGSRREWRTQGRWRTAQLIRGWDDMRNTLEPCGAMCESQWHEPD